MNVDISNLPEIVCVSESLLFAILICSFHHMIEITTFSIIQSFISILFLLLHVKIMSNITLGCVGESGGQYTGRQHCTVQQQLPSYVQQSDIYCHVQKVMSFFLPAWLYLCVISSFVNAQGYFKPVIEFL
jgi:hypothetical protein